MQNNEVRLLGFLSEKEPTPTSEIERHLGIDRDTLASLAEQLAAQGAIEVTRDREYAAELSEEGRRYAKAGLPEETLVKRLKQARGAESLSKLRDNIGVSWAKRNGWITIEAGRAALTKDGERAARGERYPASELLKGLSNAKDAASTKRLVKENEALADILVKRSILALRERTVIVSIKLTRRGASLKGSKAGEGIGQLTREMITNNRWEGEKFKRYDINAPVEGAYPARLHPLHEFIDKVRDVWLSMGFTEVSSPIIESAFWNFDALFSPQDHPTRDMQDTFFISNPKEIDLPDIATLNSVRKMHLKGWGEEWRKEIAKQALLRTHLTSASARRMRLSARRKETYPQKFFSIGRVFRNESIDYKHLADFYQTDGIVIGDGLSLSNLMDILKSFYSRVGIDAKFHPSYFPFTEPSVEVYYYDEQFGENIELNGAGVIRKEITKAMGLNKRVLAWGIGLERPMFKSLKMDSIADLYKNNLGWLRSRGELKL